jgi:hypothetical protein
MKWLVKVVLVIVLGFTIPIMNSFGAPNLIAALLMAVGFWVLLIAAGIMLHIASIRLEGFIRNTYNLPN